MTQKRYLTNKHDFLCASITLYFIEYYALLIVMHAQKQILLVEDEAAIAEPLIYVLNRENWHINWQTNAGNAIRQLEQHTFDFIILDVGLPDMDGFDLCRRIRQQWQTPLLFLTARQDEIERIIGLELGADDYCSKPFSAKELISRIKSIWRRMDIVRQEQPKAPQNNPSTPTTDYRIQWGDWLFEPASLHIYYHQQLLNLTRYEFKILQLFLQQPDRVFSRGMLMEQLWEHPDHRLERTIDTHIKSLRQKLKHVHEDDPIITHRGFGYSLSKR